MRILVSSKFGITEAKELTTVDIHSVLTDEENSQFTEDQTLCESDDTENSSPSPF